MVKKAWACAALALLVAGCEKYKEEYNKSFIESWKTSFVSSCAPDGSPPEQKELCVCVAEQAVVDLTVEQLSDVAYATKYVTDTLIPACQNQ